MSQSGHAFDDHGYDDDLEIPRPSASFRVPRRRAGMDTTTRNMALVAAGIAGVIVLAVAGQALMRPSGLPVVAAQEGPWRVKPANPGGMQVTGAGNAIFNGARPSGQDKAMPGPETPDLAALARDEHKAAPQTAQPDTAAAPMTAESSVPAGPAAPEASKTAMVAPTPVPAQAPKAAAMAPPTDHAVATPAAKPVPAAAGKAEVQLGALPTEAAAHAEWQRLSRLMPGLLGHHTPQVTKAEVNGHTWWRLRTTGFASGTEAKDFCAQVKAKGGACAVERS